MPKYVKWDNTHYIRAFAYGELTITTGATVSLFDFTATAASSRYRSVSTTRISGNVTPDDWYAYKVPFAPPYTGSGSAVIINSNNGTLAPHTKFTISQNRATSPTGSWDSVVNTPSMAWISSNSSTGSAGIGITTQAMYDYFINSLQPASGFTEVINAWKKDKTYSSKELFSSSGYLAVILAQVTQNGDYVLAVRGNNGSWYSGLQGASYTATYVNSNSVTADTNPNAQGIDVTAPDPYNEIVGSSTTGGGNGSGDFTGQVVGEPSLPPSYGLNSGFISAYSPSVATLNQLATYMWTTDFAENLKKVFGDNPMNTILGLSCVPVQPPLGGGSSVILGNIDTGISMPTIGAQYTKVNCGSIAIEPKYGAFLDYEPYTSIDLFLPYIGMVQLSTNDVMGKSLGVVYTVDVLSGACVANVSCGGSIMYTFEGACATQFPVTNNDYSNMFKAAVDAASSIVGAVGGAVASGMTGNIAGAVTSLVDGAAGAATAAMNAHPTVNRSGSLSGSAGLMGIQSPFIVWTTPNMVASNRQNSFIGYPNFITTSLSGCAGYTEVENINLGIAGATSEEVAEIKTLLKNGVIF